MNFLIGAASELKNGDTAPGFILQTDEGSDFDLESRRGKWTVLYFYPRAHTPGCTRQACAFRDNISQIRNLGAEIFGVSTDRVPTLVKFKKQHNINFVLLADPDLKAVKAYGTKMPLLKISRRWTFIIDPNFRIASTDKNIDPVLDAERVAKTLEELQVGG
jgi:peroxiredoxin Q/BCP